MIQNPHPKLRVLLDANTLFSGCAWPRFPYEVLRHAVLGDYQLLLSPHIIEEARRAIIAVAPSEEHRLDHILSSTDYEEVPSRGYPDTSASRPS